MIMAIARSVRSGVPPVTILHCCYYRLLLRLQCVGPLLLLVLYLPLTLSDKQDFRVLDKHNISMLDREHDFSVLVRQHNFNVLVRQHNFNLFNRKYDFSMLDSFFLLPCPPVHVCVPAGTKYLHFMTTNKQINSVSPNSERKTAQF